MSSAFHQRSYAGPGRRPLVVAGEQRILAIQNGVFHHGIHLHAAIGEEHL